VSGTGIRYPIKAQPKEDKMGIGAEIPMPKRGDEAVSKAVSEAKERKAKEDARGKLGKGWLKRHNEEERKRRNRLHEMFYESEEIAKHLER
jgi:hypothetical protein